MESSDFFKTSAKALARIDAVLGEVDDERLDVQLAGDVLTIGFADGTRYVINAHSAARQVWMAAGTTAWHFDYEDGRWVAKRTGDELMGTVARVVGAKLGTEVAV